MPSHGTCFIGAREAWSCIAVFAQQSVVAVCAASPQTAAIKRADGIA
jgi:hypothetical protein